MTRIMLVDDHEVVRMGIEAAINSAEDMRVVGSFSDGGYGDQGSTDCGAGRCVAGRFDA